MEDERLRRAASRAVFSWRDLHGVAGCPTEEPQAEREFHEAMETLEVVLIESKPPDGWMPSGRCSQCSATFGWCSGKGLKWSVRVAGEVVLRDIPEDIYLWRCLGCDNHMMDRVKVDEIEAAVGAGTP